MKKATQHYMTLDWIALDIPLYRTNKGQESKPFFGPNTWNKLSSNIKTAANKASFMHSLKK